VKLFKFLPPVLLGLISTLVLLPAPTAYPLTPSASTPLGSLDAEAGMVSTCAVPWGSNEALSPSPAMTLSAQDLRKSLEVSAASAGDSPSGASPTISQDGGKSKAKALALSTLLPGAGQYYAGRKGRASFFFLMESAIWTSFIVFEVQGYLRKDNYIDYAELMAGVAAEGKPEDFYRALGRYMQSDPGPGSYNEDVRREARALYPDDKQKQDQYVQENGYFGENAWQWQSEEDRAYYRNLRKKSQLSFSRATYMLGVAVANRILSAMDATRSVTTSAKPTKGSQGLRFEMRTNPDSPEHLMVCLTRYF
jgi:hypothetical protein